MVSQSCLPSKTQGESFMQSNPSNPFPRPQAAQSTLCLIANKCSPPLALRPGPHFAERTQFQLPRPQCPGVAPFSQTNPIPSPPTVWYHCKTSTLQRFVRLRLSSPNEPNSAIPAHPPWAACSLAEGSQLAERSQFQLLQPPAPRCGSSCQMNPGLTPSSKCVIIQFNE
jgi:hypothetical protein